MSYHLYSGKAIRTRAAPLPEHDWERLKPVIEAEYKRRTLDELMIFMKDKHEFEATEQQFKRKFNLWGLNKYVKGDEMTRLIADPSLKQATNGRQISESHKRRYIRRKRGIISTNTGMLSPIATTDDGSPRSVRSEDLPPAATESGLPANSYDQSPAYVSDTDQQFVGSLYERTSGLSLTHNFKGTNVPVGTSLPLNTVHLATISPNMPSNLDLIKQHKLAEIEAIKRIDVTKWSKVHFAILWKFTVDHWPSAVYHRHFPIGDQSWRWSFENDLTINDIFTYTDALPDNFAEQHAFILAALFTVRFWAKADQASVNSRYQNMLFSLAVARLATRRACSCLYEAITPTSQVHNGPLGDVLSEFSSPEEAVIVHTEMMKTIDRDLTTTKFTLWESNIFQYVDEIRLRSSIKPPSMRASGVCDSLEKYLPLSDYAKSSFHLSYSAGSAAFWDDSRQPSTTGFNHNYGHATFPGLHVDASNT